MNTRTYFSFLYAGGFLFVLLFAVLSYYNRLAADDFYYLGGYSEIGVWGCMRELYIGYSGRWAAYLVTGSIISFHSYSVVHFLFSVFTLSVLIFNLYLTIGKIFEALKVTAPEGKKLLYALLLSCSLFFSSYSTGETWFWLVQVCTYLWSIIMSLVLLNVFLSDTFKIIHIPLIIICAAYIGGASESFALVNIFLLGTGLFFFNRRHKNSAQAFLPRNRSLNYKMAIALCFLTASFTVTMFAPGNEIRYSNLPHVSFIQTVWIQVKSFIKIIFIKTPLKLHYLLLLSFPWFVLGRTVFSSNTKTGWYQCLRPLKKYFIALLSLVFIFLIPTSVIMSELGPDRAMSQISFLIAGSFAALFFYLGAAVSIRENVYHVLKPLSAVLFTATMVFILINQYSIAGKYAAAYDSRMQTLQALNENGQKELAVVEPLPFSGMLYTAEISKDTMHFTNQLVKGALHLKFVISKK